MNTDFIVVVVGFFSLSLVFMLNFNFASEALVKEKKICSTLF